MSRARNLANAVAAAGGLAPTGVVLPFAGAAAPVGWLLCYGQTVSRATYAALFAAIGTTYGAGDGSTTFALPDLRGRIAGGKDDMGGTGSLAADHGRLWRRWRYARGIRWGADPYTDVCANAEPHPHRNGGQRWRAHARLHRHQRGRHYRVPRIGWSSGSSGGCTGSSWPGCLGGWNGISRSLPRIPLSGRKRRFRFS